MKSLCLFASYFSEDDIPYYVKVYLLELKKQYTEVFFVIAEKKLTKEDLNFLDLNEIKLFLAGKKGFDFGKWYQVFQSLSLEVYDRIALVNDSCVLFKSLDEFENWSLSNKADLQGMTLSEAIYPHVQSYFLVLNKKAIALTWEYFQEHGVKEDISDVILTYEVGLSRFLQTKGLELAAFVDNDGYKGEFSPYYHCIDYQLSQGIPLIKKKIVFSSYRKSELATLARMNFNIDAAYYLNLISQNTKNLIIDIKRISAVKGAMTNWDRLNYQLLRLFYKMARPINKLLKSR